MSAHHDTSEMPTAAEILRSVSLAPMAFVVCTTAIPGFLYCVPALIFAAALIAIPIVAVLAVVAVVAAVVATPVLAVRAVRRIHLPHVALALPRVRPALRARRMRRAHARIMA